ncbi:MAG TPA: hypothetical protein VD768_04095 [Sphingomicrobium sp.]|nr:hypothetical protein [Sphingomicrobium sp.]
MRKLLISFAAAVSVAAFAAPASAQYRPAPQGNAYGYQNNYGQTRQLQARVQELRQRIRQLDRSNRLSNREARRLDSHAAGLQHRINVAARQGLNWRERDDIGRRIEALGHAIRYEIRDGNNRWGWNGSDRSDNAYGYYGQRRGRDGDRDRRDDDGRLDRDDDDRDGRGRGRNRDVL